MVLLKNFLNNVEKKGKYQAIPKSDYTDSIIINTNDFETPDVCVFTKKIGEFDCSLLQYSLTENDIKNDKILMFGYFFKHESKSEVYGSINMVFSKDKDFKGKFCILAVCNEYENEIIDFFDIFTTQNEMLEKLTTTMCEIFLLITED